MSCPVTPLITEDNRIILRQAGYSPDEVLEAAQRYEASKAVADADFDARRLDAHEKSAAARDEAGRELEAVTAPTMSWQDAMALSDLLMIAAANARRAQLAEHGATWFTDRPEVTAQRVVQNFGLTRREQEIAALLVDGVSRPDIAKQLYISENTLRTHVQSILRKTGTNTAIAAAAAVRKAGLAS